VPKSKPKLSVLEKQLMQSLYDLCIVVDEDVPSEHRSDDFREILKDGFEILKKEGFLK